MEQNTWFDPKKNTYNQFIKQLKLNLQNNQNSHSFSQLTTDQTLADPLRIKFKKHTKT